ncbi:hypothetical protein V1527DRAFT_492383 [Lipomyces starkeyi]
MSSESAVYTCYKCSHEPFDTKALPNMSPIITAKRILSKPGERFQSLTYGTNSCLLCPECNGEWANIGSLRRHLNRHCNGSTRNNGNEMDTGEIEGGVETTGTNAIDRTSLEGMGMICDSEWNVLICKWCHHIVDPSMMGFHLTKVHKLTVEGEESLPYLIVIWDVSTEQEMDDSDDEGTSAKEFEMEAFRPGSAAISEVPIADGFKCLTCEQALMHKCLQSKGAMRTHLRGAVQTATWSFVVTETTAGTHSTSETDDYATFGIPANVHSVPTSQSVVADQRDLNLFGRCFFAYKLLE